MASDPTIRRVHSASPYEPIVGYCRAVRAGDRIVLGGTAPITADGGNAAPADAYAQTVRCLEVIDAAIGQLVGDGEEAVVVRTRAYLTDAALWPEVGRAHGERFAEAPPVTAFVEVAALLDPEWLVELEAEAVVVPTL